MPMGNKLEQWRNKTEQEKHALAVVGATVLTSLVVLAWGYTSIVALDKSGETATTAEYSEQFSPLASVKNLFNGVVENVKVGGGAVKDSAVVILGGDTAN